MANERFEGAYGRLYSTVIKRKTLRRAAFTVWGSSDPLLRLDEMIADAAARTSGGTILDVPCGAGTLLPLFASAGFDGQIVESDLADAMMRRARATAARLSPASFGVSFVQADALDLPLDAASVDAVVSVNGLHVIPGPERFLAELARVLKPGGRLWLITPVTSTGVRNRAILTLADRLDITPGPPPTLAELHMLLAAAGFTIEAPLGGTSITGLVATHE